MGIGPTGVVACMGLVSDAHGLERRSTLPPALIDTGGPAGKGPTLRRQRMVTRIESMVTTARHRLAVTKSPGSLTLAANRIGSARASRRATRLSPPRVPLRPVAQRACVRWVKRADLAA